MKEYVISVDIAKRRDYTSIMVFRDNPEIVDGVKSLDQPDKILHHYDVVHIEKFQGLTYPEISQAISTVANHRNLSNNHDLIVDGTGVGEAVIDTLRLSGHAPIPIIFTSGGRVSEISAPAGSIFKNTGFQVAPMLVVKEIHVPKVDLVNAGRILVQQARVRVAQGIMWADEFKKQMMAFTGKVNETGRVKYEADKEEDHDDLVVCFLMAAWWFSHRRKTIEESIIPDGTAMEKPGDWNPYDF